MDKKTKRNIGLVMLATAILSLLCFVGECRGRFVEKIERNSYGGGKKKETLSVAVEDEMLDETFEIEANEREYKQEELRNVFERAMEKLPEIVLGDNKSPERVEHNLNLITVMPDEAIEIMWESEKSNIINALGEIQEENLSGTGDMVELRGILSYGSEQCIYMMNVMVYPKSLTEKEKLLAGIEGEVLKSEEESRTEAEVLLPKSIEGKRLTWERKKEYTGIWILMLGVVASMMLAVQEKQKKQKERKEKEIQMKLDYPEIVSQISLLTGAGMTVKSAWKKMVERYLEYAGEKNKRFAYEEMAGTMREMQSGITESECYERFGKRTGLACYVKLGTLLSQNIRKGTKGLSEALALEAGQALEERRQTAKRQGEEISTKLLLPMSMMLVVVLVIVVVPAFLSISL